MFTHTLQGQWIRAPLKLCVEIVITQGLRHDTQLACHEDPPHARPVWQPKGWAQPALTGMTTCGNDLKTFLSGSKAKNSVLDRPGHEPQTLT